MKKWRVMNREAICLQLADKINHLKNNDKIISERLAGIRLLYGVEPGPRTPVMYQPGIIFLFSGHKIGYINKRKFRYDANEYLLLTVPLLLNVRPGRRRRYRWPVFGSTLMCCNCKSCSWTLAKMSVSSCRWQPAGLTPPRCRTRFYVRWKDCWM